MVITVTCPSCSSSFPVDSEKVPAKGVNARCSTCGDVFRIEKPAEEAAPPAPPAAPEPEAASEAAPEAPPASPKPTFYDEPAPDETAATIEDVKVMPPPSVPEMPPPSVPETPAAPAEPEPAPAAEPAAEEPVAPAADAGFRFGKRDPTDKAKRLARVLVSDMIMYNADRHASALAAGTLKEDFEDEIEKSWKEFVEQVGVEIAEGPGLGFWTEALNDILAKGEELF